MELAAMKTEMEGKTEGYNDKVQRPMLYFHFNQRFQVQIGIRSRVFLLGQKEVEWA